MKEQEYQIINYLITSEGDVLTTRQEIVDYLEYTSHLLKQIRQTPKFASEFHQGDISEYQQLEETLKLSTKDHQKLDYNAVYEWLNTNKVK